MGIHVVWANKDKEVAYTTTLERELNKQAMGCEAQPACKCLFTPPFWWFSGF